MRIIAGSRRGAILTNVDASKTRPTTDRIRESIFNILHANHFGSQLTDIHVIDVFAGTGAFGLEALSRGAAFASFVENDDAALAVLRTNIAKLRFQSSTAVIALDALSLSRWRGTPAHLVLADAPYHSGDGIIAITSLIRIGAVANSAVIVVETDKIETFDIEMISASRLRIIEARTYGKTTMHFLTYQA